MRACGARDSVGRSALRSRHRHSPHHDDDDTLACSTLRAQEAKEKAEEILTKTEQEFMADKLLIETSRT